MQVVQMFYLVIMMNTGHVIANPEPMPINQCHSERLEVEDAKGFICLPIEMVDAIIKAKEVREGV